MDENDPTKSRFAKKTKTPTKKPKTKALPPLNNQVKIQKEKAKDYDDNTTKLKITNTFMDGQLNRYKKTEAELNADKNKTYDEITGMGDVRGVEAEEIENAVYRTNKFMPAKKVSIVREQTVISTCTNRFASCTLDRRRPRRTFGTERRRTKPRRTLD